MQRRSANGRPVKGQRSKKPTRKASAAHLSTDHPQEQLVERLRRERDEALEQQTATAEVLRVINSSPGNLAPVFEAILEKAHGLCAVTYGSLQLYDGNEFRAVAVHGLSEAFAERLRQGYVPGPNHQSRRLMEGERFAQTPDIGEIDDPISRAAFEHSGIRTALFIPLRKEGRLIGQIVAARREVRPFNQKEIALLENFAAQAVIAIENARLFNETQEALERQTATADILKVIASSPSDTRPVFEAIARRAKTLIGGFSSTVFRFIDGVAYLEAFTPTTPAADEVLKITFPRPVADFAPFRIAQAGDVTQIPDTEASTYELQNISRARGYRSMLFAPLMNDGMSIGFIAVTRVQPGAFADHHVQLLRTFADQAVIAIENARLFNETKEALRKLEVRSSELAESLQHQTATSQILSVISSSKADIQPVFDAIVDSAARLFEPCGATITTLKEGKLRWNASAATLPDFDIDRAKAIYPIPFDPERSPSARALLERRIIEIPDIAAPDTPEFTRKAAAAGGFQSATFVPLIKQEKGIGTIILTHLRAGFRLSEKQLALVSTFADQAVIAIENARLFNETQEALERQTATADILKVIASSPSDVQPVFQAIADRSNRMVDALSTTVFRLVDGMMHLRAFTPTTPEADATLQATFPAPLSTFSWGESIRRGEIYRVIDTEHEPEGLRDLARLRGWRSCLCVPLLRDGKLIGMIGPTRAEPGPFADHHVQLLQTFADQAVIAISNVGLFNEVQERTRELSASLDDLRTAQDRLVQTEKLASLGQLTAGIAHEIKNPLNFVNNFSALSAELIDELDETLATAPLDQKMRDDVGELSQMLKSNLEKVVEHGKRADSIVKNMLLHSREGSGEHRSADINALVEESLNLAYHGARAEKPGFNVTLKRDLDPDAGAVELYPQEITRALLNLISNGFYAATQRKSEEGETFEPVLIAATKNLGSSVEIRIRDNGTGIPAEVKEKMFNPFFTTKPAGEGTGLGLSMSHDIIVKQHGGRIEVETEPEQFTEFTIVLPRTSNIAKKANTRGQT
jgi:two-component system, NtrC family, sensor kinase